MSLIDPNNPARWADGTPRSQNNGFTSGFGEPINWRPLQRANHQRHVAAGIVSRQRANGTDHSTIRGMSKRNDKRIAKHARRKAHP